MSEYQYVAFRAVDRPLDDKQLAFAEQQSSHSELSKWEMSVEYHYSSFRGDVDGLLRRGFDIYLAYANYGEREIRLRLPNGLPFPQSLLKQYLLGEALTWKKDAKGSGGILTVAPFHESDSIDEVWDFEMYLRSLVKIREQLIAAPSPSPRRDLSQREKSRCGKNKASRLGPADWGQQTGASRLGQSR